MFFSFVFFSQKKDNTHTHIERDERNAHNRKKKNEMKKSKARELEERYKQWLRLVVLSNTQSEYR